MEAFACQVHALWKDQPSREKLRTCSPRAASSASASRCNLRLEDDVRGLPPAAVLADVECDHGVRAAPEWHAAGERLAEDGQPLTFLGQDEAVVLPFVEPEHFAAHSV